MSKDTFDYLLNGDGNDTTPEGFTAQQNEGTTNKASTQEATNETNNEAIAQAITDLLSKYSHSNDETIASAITQLLKKYNHSNNEASVQGDNQKTTRILKPRTDDEIAEHNDPIRYIIKGYIRRKALHMLYGESGCGKGFCILDMCEAITRTEITSWHGKSIKHGDVVYFCGESADGLNARIKAWKNTRNVQKNSGKFLILDSIFHLDEKDKNSDYYIDNIIADIKAMSDNLALVVFDTVNIYFGGEENSASDVGKFFGACRKIINECGCAVLVVHHTGLAQDAKNRSRGSSAFKSDIDVSLQLKRSGNLLTLINDKEKEREKQPDMLFNLVKHEIPGWFDEDGEPITSCTIEPATELMQYREEKAEEKAKDLKKPKYPDSVIFALDTFREAAKLHGEIITDNPETGHETIRLDVEKWRETFYKESTADSNEKKRVNFDRARKYTAQKYKILTHDNERGIEYYYLDLSDDKIDAVYRAEIRTAIKNRKKAEAEKSAKTNDTGVGGGEAEADTTQNLF